MVYEIVALRLNELNLSGSFGFSRLQNRVVWGRTRRAKYPGLLCCRTEGSRQEKQEEGAAQVEMLKLMELLIKCCPNFLYKTANVCKF